MKIKQKRRPTPTSSLTLQALAPRPLALDGHFHKHVVNHKSAVSVH